MKIKPLLGLLTLLPLLLTPGSSWASLPDLCDDLHLNEVGAPITDSVGTPLARFCELTGPTPPLWADHVCCAIGNSATCIPTDVQGRCSFGAKFWCDYGELIGGEVTCYQPLPDACAEGFCDIAPPGGGGLAGATPLCCGPNGCYELAVAEPCTFGYFVFCESPYTMEGGGVGCADDD